MVLNNPLFVARNSRSAAYEIEQSLRFDGTGRFSRTMGAGDRRTATISCWLKSSFDRAWFIDAAGGSNNASETTIYMSTSSIGVGRYDSSWGSANQSYRDPSAWYHVLWVLDTNNSTGSDRIRVYVNGVRKTFTFGTTPSQGEQLAWNNSHPLYIGHRQVIPASSGDYYRGYLAEMYHVDGTALDPTDFGEFDNNGVWRPIEATGLTFGTNGFYLKFDPTATNGIGHDHSGNGNHFTPTGFSTTAGSGYDVMSDTPTNNYCTWNPLFKQGNSPTYSEGNLVVGGDPSSPILGTIGVSSGKWYWEVTPSSNSSLIGICGPVLSSYSGNLYDQSTGYCYASDGRKGNNGSLSSYGASYSNDVIGVALDLDAGTLVFYKNGTSQGTAFTGLSGTFFPAVSDWGISISFTLNCGQRAFEQTVPTGYKSLNTANLPAPTVKDGSQNIQTVLWTGTGSSRTQTGYNFQPDLLWIMNRSNSGMNVRLHDVVRGDNGTVMYRLGTNQTNTEDVDSDVTGLTSTGFTIGNDGTDHPNVSGYSYVGWGWKAGQSSGSSNTSGSVTSTVSVNQSAGFSIITWNTSSSSTYTVGHGLGVAPKLLILKKRDGSSNWFVRHGSIHTGNGALFLNSYTTGDSGSTVFNGTNPSSTLIYLNGASTDVRGSQVCYAFAEVENFSKFGIYERNGSSDGPYIHLGFTPALILIKEYAAGTESWALYDNKRPGYNPNDTPLFPDSTLSESYIESTYTNEIDFLSNGFKLRNSDSRYNSSLSNYRYLYAAWAVNPFGGNGVSPATAR